MLMRRTNPRPGARGQDWTKTASGEARGYIEPHALDELWYTMCLATSCKRNDKASSALRAS